MEILKVCDMEKEVMLLTGAGQIGMAIARRMGYGMKIVVGDKRMENAQAVADTMNRAGFDVLPVEMDLSSRVSILGLIETAQQYGEIAMLVNAAGVSPSQASVETILKVDLYGTAVLLEEVGKVIRQGGTGVTIASQSGHRLPALGAEIDAQLACTPTEELLSLEVLQPSHIRDTLHAYQLAKRCNVKRVMSEAVRWGERGARLNSISPGIIVTPLALDEFNGVRGEFYKKMFAQCPAHRPGTADEVANVAELLMSNRGAFITGSDFLVEIWNRDSTLSMRSQIPRSLRVGTCQAVCAGCRGGDAGIMLYGKRTTGCCEIFLGVCLVGNDLFQQGFKLGQLLCIVAAKGTDVIAEIIEYHGRIAVHTLNGGRL